MLVSVMSIVISINHPQMRNKVKLQSKGIASLHYAACYCEVKNLASVHREGDGRRHFYRHFSRPARVSLCGLR